jgi:hypothetical protein
MRPIAQLFADGETIRHVAKIFTANVAVFFIQPLIDDVLFGLEDGFEDVGFAVLVAVRAHREIHLVGVGVELVGLVDAENDVGRAEWDVVPP